MTLDLLLVVDLILIKTEVVFKFAERFFDTPAQEIRINGSFNGHCGVIGNQNVNIFIIGIGPFVKYKEDL